MHSEHLLSSKHIFRALCASTGWCLTSQAGARAGIAALVAELGIVLANGLFAPYGNHGECAAEAAHLG